MFVIYIFVKGKTQSVQQSCKKMCRQGSGGMEIIMSKKILVVDDEKAIAEIIKYTLVKEDFAVETAFDGEEAIRKIFEKKYDLIILDIMLPGKDGFQICREVREKGLKTPIIMLTARETEIDKVMGLELGADDYITKPFSNREMVARVKAVLRRLDAVGTENSLSSGELEADLNTMEVYKNKEKIELTFREFSLLVCLMKKRKFVFSREKLLDDVWGFSYAGEDRVVDVMIRRLREKIEDNPAEPRYICTKRGVGYYFRED